MRLAQSGDRDALESLLQRVQTPLFRYILHLVGDPDEAKDVLQEVFVRIYRGVRWLHDPALFMSWAYRIASREAFRALRRHRRWRDSLTGEEDLPDVASGDEPVAAAAWRDQLAEHVAALSPGSRAVVALHYLHEMPLDEVAAVLGIPLGTVKSRLAYGLRCLRMTVKDDG